MLCSPAASSLAALTLRLLPMLLLLLRQALMAANLAGTSSPEEEEALWDRVVVGFSGVWSITVVCGWQHAVRAMHYAR